MDNNLITKHNSIVQAGYRLTLNEMRIILYGLSLINPQSNDFPLEYEIDLKKFINFFALKENKNIYSEIKSAVMDKLWEREFTINISESHKKRYRWLNSVEYGDNEGYLKIFINPQIKPLLHELHGNFTSYRLNKISYFQSVYSVRIYEIALMHLNRSKKNKTSFDIEIPHLKEQLDLTNKYKIFTNFKERILKPAKKDINKHSDIHLTYTFKKRGRSFHEIRFTITKKTINYEIFKNKKNTIISQPILHKAKYIIQESGTNWDIKDLEKQFVEYSKKAGHPKDIEQAFIGFVIKKTKKTA